MPSSRQAEELFQSALRLFDSGDLPGAAAGFEQVLGIDASHQLAHYQLGNVRREQKRYPEAEREFEAALVLSPVHAESHNNLGVVQQVEGRNDEAIASYERAVKLKPALTQAYLNLGRLLTQLGRGDEAAACYRHAVSSSDRPEIFVHLLDALEGHVSAGAPASYVRATFDGFARQFDEHLVGRLGYRLPEAIADAVGRVRPFAPASADVLDLGCGTGLSGAALAPLARRLVGVDLSPRMLQEARARGSYHELSEADILAWMRAAQAAQFDLIVAADVFIYLGMLDAIFSEAARLSRPRALFAFSVEQCAGADWQLQESGRYAHSATYVERMALEHRFAVSLKAEQPIRKPIVGLLYVLTKL
ncbi:MAG TPA: tetratricopeptide repeat protein [Stellaceae bacterium]|nr:tetratricopeptide repeat protein [Stellaceae bacterium]